MRVISIFTGKFKLIIEFDNQEYRFLDIKKFLKNDKGLLAEVRDDLNMFCSVKIHRATGTLVFDNGVDFDNEILYKSSTRLDNISGSKVEEKVDSVERNGNRLRNTDEYKIGYSEGYENGLVRAIQMMDAGANDEKRIRLAVSFMSDLPFPKIIEHFRLSVNQAKTLVKQVEFAEYEKDEFDLYVENDGFFNEEDMKGIYQFRLESAKRDIVDTPVSEIISGSKILSKDLKKLLIEFIEEQEKAGSKDRGKGER